MLSADHKRRHDAIAAKLADHDGSQAAVTLEKVAQAVIEGWTDPEIVMYVIADVLAAYLGERNESPGGTA